MPGLNDLPGSAVRIIAEQQGEGISLRAVDVDGTEVARSYANSTNGPDMAVGMLLSAARIRIGPFEERDGVVSASILR